MRTALALMQPALVQASRAALETSLDAAEMNRVCRSFEGLVRDGTRASGPGRIAIEKVSIVLRVLEMRVRAIARASTPAALIWKGDAGLRDHVNHLFPRLNTTRSGGVSRSDDYHAGIDHGRKITLRMGVTERAKGRGGLLPPGSAQGEH